MLSAHLVKQCQSTSTRLILPLTVTISLIWKMNTTLTGLSYTSYYRSPYTLYDYNPYETEIIEWKIKRYDLFVMVMSPANWLLVVCNNTQQCMWWLHFDIDYVIMKMFIPLYYLYIYYYLFPAWFWVEMGKRILITMKYLTAYIVRNKVAFLQTNFTSL